MPRSQNKRIADMLDIINSDEALRHKFALLFLSILRTDFQLKDELTDVIEREIAERLRRRI